MKTALLFLLFLSCLGGSESVVIKKFDANYNGDVPCGTTVDFLCEMTSDSEFSLIILTENGTEVSKPNSTSKVVVKQEITNKEIVIVSTYTLTATKVMGRDDSGDYECRAKSDMGLEMKSYIILGVTEPCVETATPTLETTRDETVTPNTRDKGNTGAVIGMAMACVLSLVHLALTQIL